MLRKFFKIFVGLLIICAVVIGLISRKHPIILKWIAGSAKCVGKPINAIVYTNGQVNNGIKVYKIKKNIQYLLHLPEFDTQGKLQYINIDLKYKWVGRPAGININDYDFINGFLFQSEVGGTFTDFKNDMKGYDFDPSLTFAGNQIKFNIPSNQLKFDSICIKLNN